MLTLSLDSCDSKVNSNLGRGADQFSLIENILLYVKCRCPNIKIRINTCVTAMNIHSVYEMSLFIAKNKIDCWKLFCFADLRGNSVINKDMLSISDDDFRDLECRITDMIERDRQCTTIAKFADRPSLECGYYIICPNGDLVTTINGCDVCLGNLLNIKLSDLIDVTCF